MIPQMMPPVGTGKRKPFFTSMPPAPGATDKPGFSQAPGGSIAPPPPGMQGVMSAQPAQSQTTARGMMTPAGGAPANGGNPRYGADNAPVGGPRPPTPGGGVNPAWGPQGGVSPFDASSGSTGIGDFQRFSDAAYERQVGRLTPQFEAQQRSFEQDMVNRGIAPGTPAYDNARANFENARNDAFAGARTQADQLGAALQNQSFQQGATNSGLLNQLLLGQMGADASRYGADASAHASMYGANQNAQTAANRLGFDQQMGDNSFLLQLLGIGQGNQGFNNGVIGQNNGANNQYLGNNAGLLGLFQGGGQPSNIDVTGPYNNQYNAGLNTAQFNQQQNNANNQAYAQMFASFYCDRNAKDEIAPACPQDALDAIAGIPLAVWSYKADPEKVPHLGTYAQDFNKALGLDPNLHISPIDLFGALIGSVQALSARVKELESA